MALDTDRRPACGNCTHLLAEHRMGDAWSRCLTRGCDCEYDGERGGWLPTRYEVDRLRDALADIAEGECAAMSGTCAPDDRCDVCTARAALAQLEAA